MIEICRSRSKRRPLVSANSLQSKFKITITLIHVDSKTIENTRSYVKLRHHHSFFWDTITASSETPSQLLLRHHHSFFWDTITASSETPSQLLLPPLHISLTFMCSRYRLYTPPYSSAVHLLPRQSLLPGIIPHTLQPPSPRSSSLPSPLYFHIHRPPSYVVVLSSHHMLIPLQPPFPDFLWDLPHFCCPPDSFVSYPVNIVLRTSIVAFAFLRPPIYFPVPSSTPMSLPRTSVPVLPLSRTRPLDLHVHFLSHNPTYTLFQFFQMLCTLWLTSASSSSLSANIDPGNTSSETKRLKRYRETNHIRLLKKNINLTDMIHQVIRQKSSAESRTMDSMQESPSGDHTKIRKLERGHLDGQEHWVRWFL